ncbi:MAG: glycosyltransferase family 39 protein [Planctomycetes bacterium]|nr:glycosyltransferase family 39 protein [Planctomycetota bacterium]
MTGWGSWALIAVLAAGAVLRLPFLMGYGIDDDEFYSLRNAEQMLAQPPPPAVVSWPVTFLAGRVASEAIGLSAASMRLLPLLCGIAAPWVLFLLGRRLVGERAAFWAAALTALWPWHQYFSGLARYYAPLFLLGILILERLYRVLEGGSARDRAWLAGLALLAALTHTTGLLALGGGVLLLQPARLCRLGLRGKSVLVLLLLALLALAVSPLAAPVLRVLSGAGGRGYGGAHFLLSLAFNVSLVLVLLAAVGLAALHRQSRAVARYLLLCSAVPVALLAALAFFLEEVQARYALAALPAALLLCGAGLERLLRPFQQQGGLAAAGIAAACLLPLLPGLASNLVDGDRHDLPGAAAYLAPRLEQGQVLLAEGHATLGYHLFGYLRWLPPGCGAPPFPRFFGDFPPAPEQLRTFTETRADVRLLVPENKFEEIARAGAAECADWIRRYTCVEARIGRRRLDYHHNSLVVFRTRWQGGA